MRGTASRHYRGYEDDTGGAGTRIWPRNRLHRARADGQQDAQEGNAKANADRARRGCEPRSEAREACRQDLQPARYQRKASSQLGPRTATRVLRLGKDRRRPATRRPPGIGSSVRPRLCAETRLSDNRAMEVVLASPRGFCAGVERAIEIVERALELHGAPIYVRHEIVHNRYVVENLRAKGAVFVEELDEVPAGATVIFSAHGVSKQVRVDAARRGLRVFDATCPLVTKVHVEVT